MKDTPPEINRMIFGRMMARTPEERLLTGFSMLGSAKELIAAGLPEGLTDSERRRLIYERLYGEKLPDGFPSQEVKQRQAGAGSCSRARDFAG